MQLLRNTCRRNKESGIGFAQGSSGTAQGNICENNLNTGIVAEGKGSNPTLRANRCAGNNAWGIDKRNGAQPLITADNVAWDNRLGQIVGIAASAPTPTPVPLEPSGSNYTHRFFSKLGVSVTLPAMLASTVQELPADSKVVATSSDGRTKFLLKLVHNPGNIRQLYNEWTAEHTAKDPGKIVEYKVLKNNWFVVSGRDGLRGYYVKVVMRGPDALFLCLEYDENNITEEIITTISRSFTGNP